MKIQLRVKKEKEKKRDDLIKKYITRYFGQEGLFDATSGKLYLYTYLYIYIYMCMILCRFAELPWTPQESLHVQICDIYIVLLAKIENKNKN